MLEEKSYKSTIIKYVSSFVVTGLMVLALLLIRDVFNEKDKAELYKNIADAFTIPSVFLMLLSALIAVSNEGALSSISFMLKRFVKMITPFSKKDHLKYSEYLETRKKIEGYSFLFWTGLVYFIIAIFFIILFYKHY